MTIHQNLVYPDAHASLRLLNELTMFFSQSNFVNRVFVFGSHANDNWDRWSDIDLLLVTNGGFPQQWQLFNDLQQQKPILHHHTFTPKTEPSGGNVLGIVFASQSVFHNLDLNFMSLTEYQSPDSITRFGQIKQLYWSGEKETQVEVIESIPTFAVDLEERKIGNGIHWTKKAVKKVLRGEGSRDELQKCATRLQEIMLDFPEDRLMLGGNICNLARVYIQISDVVLRM